MKKYTFGFLLIGLFLSTQIFSQSQRYDLSKLENIKVSDKYELMDKAKHFFAFYEEVEEWTNQEAKRFHFIDLDNDSDLDLIFDGWSGSEPMIIRLFLNINGQFVEKMTQFIDLIDIQFSNNKLSSMHIYNPGCCMEIFGHDYFYEFNILKDSIDYWFVEHYKYHNETERPKKMLEKPIKFEVANAKYYLRITPAIDTKSWFYPDESRGNLMKEYTTGDIGTAIAESTDETGRVWWYVIMEPKGYRTEKTNVESAFAPKIKGWMSSRFVKVLN